MISDRNTGYASAIALPINLQPTPFLSRRDPEQTADILTKPLLKPKHQRHRREMGMGATK